MCAVLRCRRGRAGCSRLDLAAPPSLARSGRTNGPLTCRSWLLAQFEQTSFEPERPFAWANTPSKLAVLIKQMGSTEPAKRPNALELIDQFVETKLAGMDRRGENGARGGCVVS